MNAASDIEERAARDARRVANIAIIAVAPVHRRERPPDHSVRFRRWRSLALLDGGRVARGSMRRRCTLARPRSRSRGRRGRASPPPHGPASLDVDAAAARRAFQGALLPPWGAEAAVEQACARSARGWTRGLPSCGCGGRKSRPSCDGLVELEPFRRRRRGAVLPAKLALRSPTSDDRLAHRNARRPSRPSTLSR